MQNNDFTPPPDPLTLFSEWYALAEKHEPSDPNAMALATVNKDGMPSVRIVLLKAYEDGGLTFYTNKESRKGEDLAHHPKASLCLYWKSLKRQIRAEGMVELLSDAKADAYFATRPRGSQIGAWASHQSKPLLSRAALEKRVHEVEKQYEGKKVPRPPYWGGYRLNPSSLEFWQERIYRLHDRIVYRRVEGEVWTDDRILYRRDETETVWRIERLYP